MKLKLIIAIVTLFSINTINAQTEFWGMMSEGGKYGEGAIYKTDGDGNNFEIQHSFFKTLGESISSPLTEASNGKLYGLASEGAVCENNGGVLYEYDISTDSYDIKYSFENDENGTSPTGKLLYANNGKLYGVTIRGGVNEKGVIFEFDPSTNTYAKVFDFDHINGYSSNPLMQAENGILYGTTGYGGSNDSGDGLGDGVIFKYDTSNGTYTKLFDFDDDNSDNGRNPTGIFVEVSTNKLYGVTTMGGGHYYGGTIYEFDISTNTHQVKQVLASYDANIGGAPSNGLTLADNGKLYGTVVVNKNSIGNKLFEYNVDTESYALLNLSGSNYLGSELLSASNGKLYGTGTSGGDDNNGVIFEFDTSTQEINDVYSFNNDDGSGYSSEALMQANNGKLYSCTGDGGESHWDGVLYEFEIETSEYTRKFDFEVSKFGAGPTQGLTQASNGKLYGMTMYGGIYIDTDEVADRYGAGTIFEFNPSTDKHKLLIEFNGLNGKNPIGGLLQASNGKIYGLTYQGGTTNWGTMFEFDIATNTQKVLYNFDINGDRENGANPRGTLMQADNGKLYGFTGRGGVLIDGTRVDNGTIFEYNIDTETLTTIHNFDDTNGKVPYSKLIQSQSGLLYGLTSNGGGYGNLGTLFSFDIATGTYTKKYSFSESTYYNPLGALTEVVIEEKSYLYGVTSANDGENDAIFKYDVDANLLTFDIEFDGNDNYNPLYTTLLLASNGNLYGAGPIIDTQEKFMFQYNIEENSLENKFDFTCKKNTSRPLYVGDLIEIDANYLSTDKHEAISNKISFAYPNPTTGHIRINSDVEISSIEIYNQLGQLVLSNYKKQNIDISNLNSGIYIIKSSDKKGTTRTQKIIKK